MPLRESRLEPYYLDTAATLRVPGDYLPPKSRKESKSGERQSFNDGRDGHQSFSSHNQVRHNGTHFFAR